MNNYILDTSAGNTFDKVAQRAREIASMPDFKYNAVEFDFNNIKCLVTKNTNPDLLWRDYANAHLMKWATVGADCLPEYTPEIQLELDKRKKEMEERHEEQRKQQAQKDNEEKSAFEALVKGIEIELTDADEYNKWKAVNEGDPYGACIFEYAEGWAKLMQAEIAKGKTVAECAQECSFKMGFLGITGFMYGAAVQTLAKCWKHGEQLRKWHNKEYDHEGEGVVNPAIITLS